MFRKFIFLILIAIAPSSPLFAWGKMGHDVICCIAQHHLNDSARAKIDSLLDGRSLVYYGNWMDSASNTNEYAYSKDWHYYNVNKNESVRDSRALERDNVVTALSRLEAEMREDSFESAEEHATALKFFIHLMGDLHQPMHLGRRSDRGGNDVKVYHFGDETSLHSIWDYHLVASSHSWSYTEWREQIDLPRFSQDQSYIVGDYLDWAEQTHEITEEIYRYTPPQTYAGYDYIDHFRPMIEDQFLRAGLRLARKLNEIY